MFYPPLSRHFRSSNAQRCAPTEGLRRLSEARNSSQKWRIDFRSIMSIPLGVSRKRCFSCRQAHKPTSLPWMLRSNNGGGRSSVSYLLERTCQELLTGLTWTQICPFRTTARAPPSKAAWSPDKTSWMKVHHQALLKRSKRKQKHAWNTCDITPCAPKAATWLELLQCSKHQQWQVWFEWR